MYDEALSCYRAAIREPNAPTVYYANLGSALYKVGKYYDAAREYQRVFARFGERESLSIIAEWANMYGNSMYALKHYRQAAEAYRKAIDNDPGKDVYHSNFTDAQSHIMWASRD